MDTLERAEATERAQMGERDRVVIMKSVLCGDGFLGMAHSRSLDARSRHALIKGNDRTLIALSRRRNSLVGGI